MITYLYHKRHKLTGLNYFGKTTRNPYTYNGSGKYWNAHLKKHGTEIETVQVWEFTDLNTCSLFAVSFSAEHNIVESKEWANLIVENGITGGYNLAAYTNGSRAKKGNKLKGRVYSAETLTKMSRSKQGLQSGDKNPMYGKTHSLESKQLQRQKALNRIPLTCKHCGVECSPNNFTRWHNNNCKNKTP